MSSSYEFEEKKEKTPEEHPPEPAPLDPATRAEIEGALGRDLGSVRVRSDPEAQAEADHLGARAFTRKQEIYFARNEYTPGTREGERLLLHELAHTLQQEGSQQESTDREALEAEADQAAEALQRGARPTINLKAAPGHPQRQEKGKATAPTILKHPVEITPVPPQGTISGGGFTIPYVYNIVGKSLFVPLVLRLPEGVSVVVTPLTNLTEGSTYRVQDAGGTRARAVVISVDNKLKPYPKVQVTFTRGSASYLVVFQFPSEAGKP